ncbi:hypothetical protein [Arthrobacter rhombi]|uniref:hypothetical protein n=1 Tax=Arthrobacter rhombi TaxID=71253 RepID=UPI003FD580A6
MRDVPAAMLAAFDGSTSGAVLSCAALYDGEVVRDNLDVSSWSMTWRLGDQQTVQGSASFTIQDDEGLLAPWGYSEPLSVGGSRIQSMFECAGESVPLGEWLITRNQPNELWRLTRYGSGQSVRWVNGGATVPVEGADLTQLLSNAKFMAPEAPPRSGATVFSEIERLCSGLLGVEFVGVQDRSVPRTMVYAEERINTIADLAHMVGEYRVNGDGLLQVFNPERPAAPQWEIAAGPGGALITVGREQSQDALFNAVTASGQTEDGEEIRAYATTPDGPLRWDGPFGQKPTEMTSASTTYTSMKLEAEQYLRDQVESATTTLNVYCAANPAYEIGDWGVVAQPVIDGSAYPLVGRCVEVEISGGADGISEMRLAMECATADVLAVARYIRSSQI